ncbi:MAG: gamma carbonic anhydrase family protein [Carboxydocellales bacterium]
MGFYEFEGKQPRIGKDSYIHPEATIIGNVSIGEGCYVAAGARIRGDWGSIVIGHYSNVQENCVIHVYPGETAVLGSRSHVGHGAILHTPNLGDHVLVGMGAIIMDRVTIGSGCCIGAGTLITEGMVIPPYKIVMGVPAKVVADVDDEMKVRLDKGTAYYQALPDRCFKGMKEVRLVDILEKSLTVRGF